jgi:transposase
MHTTPTRRRPTVSIPRGDRAALEERRMAAVALFREGLTQAEVSRRLRVSRESTSRWYAQWQDGGARALRAAARTGRPARITDQQLGRVERALLRGARAHGFPTDLWTLQRIAAIIEQVTGERYHPGHVWRILRRLGWSLQRPARRAVERDQAASDRWVKERWPRVKKTPGGATPG